MNTYTKQQAEKLQPKVFAYDSPNGQIQIKAYLKENAMISFCANHPELEIKEEDVRVVRAFNSHQSPVDQVVFHEWKFNEEKETHEEVYAVILDKY